MTDQPPNALDKTTSLILFAVLAALVVASVAYFVSQTTQINSKLAATGAAETLDRLAVVEQRVSRLETLTAPSPIRLTMFYDSSDNFTKDVVEVAASGQGSLAEQNLALDLVDVKGRIDEFRRGNFNSLPVLFISEDEARRDKNLLQSVASQPQADFNNVSGFRIESLGFIYHRKRMLESECKLPDGKISLYQFTDFESQQAAGFWRDSISFQEKTRDVVDYRLRHLPLRGVHPNAWKAAEAAECARDQDKFDDFVELAYASNISVAKLKEIGRTIKVANATRFDACLDGGDKELAVNRDFTEATLTYGLNSVPVFVADCKYAFVALTINQLRDNLCLGRPDACAALAKAIPPVTGPPGFTVTPPAATAAANASSNASSA